MCDAGMWLLYICFLITKNSVEIGLQCEDMHGLFHMLWFPGVPPTFNVRFSQNYVRTLIQMHNKYILPCFSCILKLRLHLFSTSDLPYVILRKNK